MTRNLKSVYKLPANVFPKQPGFSEEPEQQNLMLKTRSRPHNQQVLVAVSIVHNLPDQYIFLLSNYFLESEPENVAIAMHWHGRGVGSLFEVKSFPGASYSQHHVVRDQQVVKGDVVRHRLQLQANHADDLDFNLLIKMEWIENLGQCIPVVAFVLELYFCNASVLFICYYIHCPLSVCFFTYIQLRYVPQVVGSIYPIQCKFNNI